MKKKLMLIFSIIVERLNNYHLYLKHRSETPVPNDNYSSLSPIANADKDNHYTDALTWALQTRSENDIRNIAITGPYGSGKSSVLKTFQNNHTKGDLHFLNISLATFKEEVLEDEIIENKVEPRTDSNKFVQPVINKGENKKKTNSADLIRLIELSILQQIFYHAEDSEIPESRFKKIKRINKGAVRSKSIATILLFSSVLFLWRESIPPTILDVINNINPTYLLSVGVIYLLGTCYLLALTIQASEKKTFNVKVPVLLLVVSLILIFNVTVSEILKWHSVQLIIPGKHIIIKTLEALALAYTITYSIIVIYNILKYISRISINKLKYQNTEIEIDTKINKSILNHHLDEILYFFEATKYNVVVIEDLDRFQQTEIFTKLREINLLLNNSKTTKDKEIVFIYAVRDDMFTDKERSKFFDFIIPIIPVINSTNSSQKLLEKNNKYNYGWTDDLIDSLSIYIDDMRLLHNICNEFEIYKNKLTNRLDQNKLLAIIVYKNLFPNDFSKLNDNEGGLWNAINSKQQFITKAIGEIDKKIKQFEPEIIELEKLKILDVKELRQLYLLQLIGKLDNFESFSINNNKKSLNEMYLEENFNYIVDNTAKYNYFIVTNIYQGHYGLNSNQDINHKFEDLEKELHSTKSFNERLHEIENWHSGKSNNLRKEIQNLEKQKIELRRLRIKDVLSRNNNDIPFCNDIKQNKLVLVLLRNGYIDEDYHDFMSIFYEGSLTKADNDFLISVKNQEPLDFSYQLVKTETLIKKVHLFDFKQPYILNNSLVTYLLNNQKDYEEHLKNIFIKLKDESEISTQFILNYLDDGDELEKFVIRICHGWIGLWKHIEEAFNIPDERKTVYFKYILSYANIDDIGELAKASQMMQRIENDKNFLSLIPDVEKLKEIISELDPDFEKIDFEKSPEDLINYVYENWNYRITSENLTILLKKYGTFDQQKFDTSNYAAIKNSDSTEIINYIENNIDIYIENVYLKIESNTDEDEKYLIQLLNNDKLSKKLKDKVISKTHSLIDLLENVIVTEIYPTLLSENKINVTWENLLHAYHSLKDSKKDNEPSILPKAIIDYINNIDHSQTLSETKTPNDEVSKSKYLDLWRTIIHSKGISDESYKLITKSCPWWYCDLDFVNLSENKVKILINNICIKPNEISYNELKEHNNGLNIYLLEKHKVEFLKLLDEIQIDSNDLELVLKSEILTLFEKIKILDACEIDEINTTNNLRLISSLLVSNSTLKVNNDIIEKILLEVNVHSEERIILFIRNQAKYDNLFIEKFIDDLDINLVKINDKSIRAKIPKTEANKQFLEILKSRGYISSFSDSLLANFYRINHKRK